MKTILRAVRILLLIESGLFAAIKSIVNITIRNVFKYKGSLAVIKIKIIPKSIRSGFKPSVNSLSFGKLTNKIPPLHNSQNLGGIKKNAAEGLIF